MIGGAPVTTISANIFASKEYALLSWLAERQTDTRDGPVVPFSQNDLVQELQCSPVTINKWMKSLCDSGCLTPYKKRGKYRINNAGQAVIAAMQEIDKIVGGNENGK